LRVQDLAFEIGHAGPIRRVSFGVFVIALAHVKEISGEAAGLPRAGADGLHGPKIIIAGPMGGHDFMAVANMPGEVVFGDHVVQVFHDFGAGGDGRADPWLETVAEGKKIAIRTNAGITMGEPGASEALLGFQDGEAGAGTLRRQVVGAADARNAGADNEHVHMFRAALDFLARRAGLLEGAALFGLHVHDGLLGNVSRAPLRLPFEGA
jgi:hypothetical protein